MPTVAEQAARGTLKRHVATHMYYRQPNGWITSGAATMIERSKFEREGWKPLDAYGRFDIHYVYVGHHPFEALFQRGGAEELPAEQVISNGFWQDPPVIPGCNVVINPDHMAHEDFCWVSSRVVEFPQVPTDTPKSFQCRFCPRQSPVETARAQHEEVAHKKEKSELRTGDALAGALAQGIKDMGKSVKKTPDSVTEPS